MPISSWAKMEDVEISAEIPLKMEHIPLIWSIFNMSMMTNGRKIKVDNRLAKTKLIKNLKREKLFCKKKVMRKYVIFLCTMYPMFVYAQKQNSRRVPKVNWLVF